MAGTILHFGAIRLRLTGSGNLTPTWYSMDKVKSSAMTDITMSSTSDVDPTRLGNFMSQYTILRLETDAIDEVFRINRIVVYVKPTWSSYPG